MIVRRLTGRKRLKRVSIIVLAFILVACSATQVRLNSPISYIEEAEFEYVLQREVTLKARKSTATILKAGTRWTKVGTIEQGTVYRTRDQVVLVNSFNVHEGYIVVSEPTVVGYYLPIEKSFVKAKPENIKLSKRKI